VSRSDAPGIAPPVEGLLDRVRAVVPLIGERASDAEQRRKPDDDVIEALEATGAFRAFVPKRFGGYEIGLDLFVDVGLAVSEACASTGWITTFYMEHNWLLQTFSGELQEEIFSRQPYVLAPGLVNPKDCTATPKGDGYELNGHWKFGTGIVHADWVLLSARVTTEPEAQPPRMFLLRPEAVEVRDTWHVDGMVATGSHDIIARAVPVAERYASLREPPGPGAGRDAPYLVRIPVLPMLALTAAIPAVGAARRSVELFRSLLRERVPFGARKLQGQRAPGQMRLANALARARAAETVLRAVAHDVTAHARGGRELSLVDQLALRLSLAHVVRDAREVVREVMDGSGASAHFLDHELQRILRDVQMISAHTIFDVDVAAEQCGRALLEADAPKP
jgi:alkylation response protein AidB-like acyl-CoA dehydrogenase